MKLVGGLVLLIVLISANGNSFLDVGPEDSAASWRFIPDDGPEDSDDGDRPEDLAFDLDKVHQTLNKMENGHSESKLRGKGSKCKPNIACTILNGYCVVNATLCSGRLVAAGCKGKNCQCCIPETVNLCQVGENSTLWQKVDAAETDIKEIINEGNLNVTRDMDIRLQALESKIDILADKIDNLTIANQGCPVGYLKLNDSNQCFKLFQDAKRTWFEGKQKCINEGLQLARPADTVAVQLSKVIFDTYGTVYPWLGARGNGSVVRWERDGMQINNNLWIPGMPGSRITTDYCLVFYRGYPGKPYWSWSKCSSRDNFVLCELIIA